MVHTCRLVSYFQLLFLRTWSVPFFKIPFLACHLSPNVHCARCAAVTTPVLHALQHVVRRFFAPRFPVASLKHLTGIVVFADFSLCFTSVRVTPWCGRYLSPTEPHRCPRDTPLDILRACIFWCPGRGPPCFLPASPLLSGPGASFGLFQVGPLTDFHRWHIMALRLLSSQALTPVPVGAPVDALSFALLTFRSVRALPHLTACLTGLRALRSMFFLYLS